MTDITLTKINETYMRVDCEESVAFHIWDDFSFMSKAAKFDKRVKSKEWSGIIRLFHKKIRRMYIGLAIPLIKWAKENDYTVDVPVPLYGSKFTTEQAEQHIEALELPDWVEKRDYQIEGFVHGVKNQRSVILSPTASGKSLMIYLMVTYILLSHEKGIIVVPTTTLVEQLYSNFEKFGMDVENICHRVHGQTGESKSTDKPLTITTWQSIDEMPKDWYHQFDFIIGDEAHHFKAKNLKHIMENMINARTRIGTTGTLDGEEVHELVITGLFGPTYLLKKTHELIDEGYLPNIMVHNFILEHPKHVCGIRKKEKWNYQKEVKFLSECEYRNRFIVKMALTLKENTLILYNFVDTHGKLIHEMLEPLVPDGTEVVFISGKSHKTKVRSEIIERLSKADHRYIIVASYGTFSTGIDLPNLTNLILALGYKARIRNLQSIGRTLRSHDSKSRANIIDISDDLNRSDNQTLDNYTLRHFKERVRTYASERFPYRTMKVPVGS